MNNDQLTRAERIRLESLAQANAYGTMKNLQPERIMEIAVAFENFIWAAREKRQ